MNWEKVIAQLDADIEDYKQRASVKKLTGKHEVACAIASAGLVLHGVRSALTKGLEKDDKETR